MSKLLVQGLAEVDRPAHVGQEGMSACTIYSPDRPASGAIANPGEAWPISVFHYGSYKCGVVHLLLNQGFHASIAFDLRSFPEPHVVQNDDACRGAVKNKAHGGQGRWVEDRISFREGRQGELKALENGFRRRVSSEIHEGGFHEGHDDLWLQIGEPA